MLFFLTKLLTSIMLTTFPTPLQQLSEAPAGCPTVRSVLNGTAYPELTRSPWVKGSVHKTGPTTDASGTGGPRGPTTPA